MKPRKIIVVCLLLLGLQLTLASPIEDRTQQPGGDAQAQPPVGGSEAQPEQPLQAVQEPAEQPKQEQQEPVQAQEQQEQQQQQQQEQQQQTQSQETNENAQQPPVDSSQSVAPAGGSETQSGLDEEEIPANVEPDPEAVVEGAGQAPAGPRELTDVKSPVSAIQATVSQDKAEAKAESGGTASGPPNDSLVPDKKDEPVLKVNLPSGPLKDIIKVEEIVSNITNIIPNAIKEIGEDLGLGDKKEETKQAPGAAGESPINVEQLKFAKISPEGAADVQPVSAIQQAVTNPEIALPPSKESSRGTEEAPKPSGQVKEESQQQVPREPSAGLNELASAQAIKPALSAIQAATGDGPSVELPEQVNVEEPKEDPASPKNQEAPAPNKGRPAPKEEEEEDVTIVYRADLASCSNIKDEAVLNRTIETILGTLLTPNCSRIASANLKLKPLINKQIAGYVLESSSLPLDATQFAYAQATHASCLPSESAGGSSFSLRLVQEFADQYLSSRWRLYAKLKQDDLPEEVFKSLAALKSHSHAHYDQRGRSSSSKSGGGNKCQRFNVESGDFFLELLSLITSSIYEVELDKHQEVASVRLVDFQVSQLYLEHGLIRLQDSDDSMGARRPSRHQTRQILHANNNHFRRNNWLLDLYGNWMRHEYRAQLRHLLNGGVLRDQLNSCFLDVHHHGGAAAARETSGETTYAI